MTKVIAIEKPGKDPRLAESYRPISLLSTCCKLLECLVLHRVSPEVEKLLSPEQAAFRRNRSTCEQVAALTTHIKNGVSMAIENRCSDSGPNSSLWYRVAYWTPIQVEQEHAALVCPTDWAIPTWPTFQGAYWRRHQHLENSGEWASSGSELSPTLFNLYTNDLRVTGSRKFIYADDICLSNTEVCRAGMLSLIGHGVYGLILSPLAA